MPILIGLAVYEAIGLAVWRAKFPREPFYMSAVWPVIFLGGIGK
jgi:hypothetical protein